MIMALTLSVLSIVPRKTARLSLPEKSTISSAPSAPIEAASVGAATPPMIEPSTATISRIGGATPLTARSVELAPR